MIYLSCLFSEYRLNPRLKSFILGTGSDAVIGIPVLCAIFLNSIPGTAHVPDDFSYGQRSKCADLLNNYYERIYSMKRIFAWAGVLIIAALVLALIVLTFTGGSANVIMALLFCLIVIPVMLYGYILITKFLRDKDKNDD